MNFIPYGKQLIDKNDISAVTEVLKSNFLTTGSKVMKFEKKISDYCGVKYAVAVSSGTAALHLSSEVLLEKEDKVLTTPNSFLATSNSILFVGAKPIFIDIKEDGNIDLDLCEEELKKDSRIKAIYVVAFSGLMVNQKKLEYLKKTYNIKIIEDCAHAIGGKEKSIKAGSCTNSDVSIFSFHPVKHMTTGEGGVITTNSKEIYERLLLFRNHGMSKTEDMKPWEYEMKYLGFNYRITDIQCALGISQLKKLDEYISLRIELAKNYDKAFKKTLVRPLYLFNGNSSYHLYVIRVNFDKLDITKEELFVKLRKERIGVQLHYMPINKQPYYRNLGYGNEKTPVMDKYYSQVLTLPLYPTLTREEQQFVIKTLLRLLK